MKTSVIALGLLAALTLTACGKKESEEAAAAATTSAADKPAAAASAAAQDANKPRPATYDPNLKPGPIVWDSPEKKAAWERRQAEILAQQKQAGAQGGPKAPVEKPAPAAPSK